jgi:hypothetical protein
MAYPAGSMTVTGNDGVGIVLADEGEWILDLGLAARQPLAAIGDDKLARTFHDPVIARLTTLSEGPICS